MFEKLGTLIRNERRALKLTQQQLADYSGTGLNFISQLERGKSTVRLDKLVDVLKILGLELRISRGKSGISIATEIHE